jgi:hypothetical protein
LTDSSLFVPKRDTLVSEIRYTKHDIFSLNTNQNEVETPIASIMNVIDELQEDGEFARVSFCLEAMARKTWVGNATWAHEKMSKGKVPVRPNAGKAALNASRAFVGRVINEINDLITDTFQALSNAFFKSDKPLKKEELVSKSFNLQHELDANRISHNTYEKINLGVFKTHIRVLAHSRDKLTRETIADTLNNAYIELQENNALTPQRVHSKRRAAEIVYEINTRRLSIRTATDPNVNVMSSDEMTKLVLQMPTKKLQQRYDDALSAKKQVQTDVPAVFRKNDGLYLGVAENKNGETPVYYPINDPDDFYKGYVFIGGQGAGKDTAIKNWVIDCCLNHGISTIIPEVIVEQGERGMADGIRDSLPPDKVIDLDFGNADYIPPLDLTDIVHKLGRDGASRFGDEIVDFLQMGDLTKSKHILRIAAKASGGSLFNLKKILTNEDYRFSIIKELRKDGYTRLANELENDIGTDNELANKADPILDRLGDFFDNEKLHDVFSQPPIPEMDFEKWMTEGKVIICRIPSRKLGPAAAKTLVHWLILKVIMTRMLMDKAGQENGSFVVFNEPEQYATEGLTKLMGRIGTEGRKERMGSLYAFHHWNKLPQSLQENLQGGGVHQFLFYNDHKLTFEKSAHRFEEQISVEEACKMPKHYAIISVRVGDILQPAFICHMKPPVKPMYDNSFLTKRHARMYARPWKELQNIV